MKQDFKLRSANLVRGSTTGLQEQCVQIQSAKHSS